MPSPTQSPTLITLSDDVTIRVTLHIDHPTALALALVCKRLQPFATDRLWRDLDFTFRHPCNDGLVEGGWVPLEEQAEALTDRLNAAMVQGQGGQFRKVQTLATLTRTECFPPIVSLLSATSTTLQMFHLEAADHQEFVDPSLGPRADSLELQFRSLDLHFPALTHVTIEQGAMTFIEFIPLLCKAAPGLTHLIFDFVGNAFSIEEGAGVPPSLPRKLLNDTHLVYLSVGYHACLSLEASNPNDKMYDPIETIIDLIPRSPHLRHLCVDYETPGVPVDRRLGESTAAPQQLEALCWVSEPLDPLSTAKTYPAVARLLVGKKRFQMPIERRGVDQSIPSLESIIFYCSDRTPRSTFPPPSAVLPINPGSARWLRARPLLHSISFNFHRYHFDMIEVFDLFDSLEAEGGHTGSIHSICHKGDGLLHLRLKLCHVRPPKLRSGDQAPRVRRVLYIEGLTQSADVPGRARVYGELLSEPEWQDFTDFDGIAVPLEVIERVKAVEDPVGSMKWDRRGVEVGDEAWRVLTEWRERQSEGDATWESECDSDEVSSFGALSSAGSDSGDESEVGEAD